MLDINSEIQNYAYRHTTSEPALLEELIDASDRELEYIDMLSGRVVGRLLNILVKTTGARRVLEIGTFTGYSALMMADALPSDGELITCEVNERYASLARPFFEKSTHSHKICLMMGEALDTLQELDGPFDFVFLDADKINYPAYYEAVLPKLSTGGLMVVDNVFWGGEVLNPKNEKAEAIDRLNKTIAEDTAVEQVMLTERDGLTIVRKC